MTKPTEQPRWASTGGADVTEPASGVKDTGYVDAGVPDAGELNWLLNRTYLWTTWLAAFESTAHTWVATQTFDAAVFNSITIGALAIDSTGALSIDGSGLVELGTDGSVGCVDLTVNNNLIVNANASLNTGSFSGALGVTGALTVAGASSFGNTLAIGNTATFAAPMVCSVAAPTSTTAKLKTIEVANTARMTALVALNNTTTNRVQEGYNVTSVTQVTGTGVCTVAFASPLATSNYQILFSFEVDPTIDARFKVLSRSTTGFTFVFEDRSGPSDILGASTNLYKFSLVVFGVQ